jgi:hypothetical protein
MYLRTLEQLRDYNNWVGKSPTEILNAVRQVPGGWASVFPHSLPLFAHQVRNFFNVEPTSLTLLPRDDSNKYVKEVRKRFEAWGFVDTVKGILALSNDVYRGSGRNFDFCYLRMKAHFLQWFARA